MQLILGMLSKSHGHVLRLAKAFHVLFHLGKDGKISDTVYEDAVKAAVNFVNTSCQQHSLLVEDFYMKSLKDFKMMVH